MLSNNIKVYRQARQESQGALARALGLHPSYVSRIERGERGCSTELALRLAQHFGVPVTALFFAEPVASKTSNGQNGRIEELAR